MSSPALIEPSVFGIFHPVLLLPENISDNLPQSQIEAILLHESAHVERRDNLGAALHMAVETVFWFNPMVWWIGKRLVEERERACDEQVLREFDPPETYAEAILNVCKLHAKTPLTCMSGVASSNLRDRIEQIMNHRKPFALSMGRKLGLAVMAAVAMCGPLLVGMVNARQLAQPASADSAFTYSSIEVPGATATAVRGIDGTGRIVGSFADRAGTHGFLFSNGKFSTIDVPGSKSTIATGINNVGQIVGAHGAGSENGNHGFLYTGGSFSSFDVPGSLDTVANGINNKGQIVGTYLGLDGLHHGFRLSGGSYVTVEVPDSHAGSAEGINDAGQIVGLSGFGANAVGFLFDGTSYSRVQPSANVYSIADGLNNLGDLVGQTGGPQAPFQGFLRSGGRFAAMNLPGNPPTWNARGINDLGQVVGEFSDRDGKTLGYLATPTTFRNAAPENAGKPSNLITGINDSGSGRRGSAGQRGQSESASADDSAARGAAGIPAAAGNRGRGAASGNRDLNALRSALQRTVNSIRNPDPENPFTTRAEAALLRAIENVSAAIALVEKNPDLASAPPVPPKVMPVFDLPESVRGAFPGRQVTLNALQGDYELLNKTPGGDLGGLREKIHAEIASAARETIADMIHERQDRELNSMRGALQRANNNLQRGGADNAYAQRAQAAVTQAIVDVAAVLVYIKEHPSTAPAPPNVVKPDFAPAVVDRGRFPGKETTLNNLNSAFDQLAAVPGGDFGGLRARIIREIVLAAEETLMDIRESASPNRGERGAPAPRGGGAEPQPAPER